MSNSWEKEGSSKCHSVLHKFPSSVPRACVFQPPCPHSADLLTGFPPCCLFSFWPNSVHIQPCKGLCSGLLWICSVFLLFLFCPILIFLALTFCLPSPIWHACLFKHLLSPAQFIFHFPFAFFQIHSHLSHCLSFLQLHRVFSSPHVICKQKAEEHPVSAFLLLPE